MPATEGFVDTAVPVYRDADIHITRVKFFGGLRQCGLNSTEDDVALDVLLARDRIHQHQHFAIHATTLLCSVRHIHAADIRKTI